jgi:glycosyltransferase involved in cell wall biosynthesis
MKIGFVSRYFYKAKGGAENYAYSLARELVKDGNEVHVFCSDKQDKEEIMEGIHVHRCKEIFAIKYYFAFYPSIVKKLLSYNFDIIHVNSFGFIQNEIAVNKYKKKNPNTKIICTPHGPFMALQKYNLIEKIVKSLYTIILKQYIKKYDMFLEDNPYQKKWMKEEYGIDENKIKFIPPGIDKEAFASNKSLQQKLSKKYRLNQKFVISYLGRIQKYKGIEQIIDVLPEIVRANPNLVFIAMGSDAGDMQRLKELARQLDIEKNVIFTGHVSDKEKYALLDISEIFLFPSEWEAFGIVLIEAMAHKNAIVSTRTEGGIFLIEEGKNGFLFNYQDRKELLEKLSMLIKNRPLREKMQKNNLKKAKDFLWRDISKKLEKIYLNLLT